MKSEQIREMTEKATAELVAALKAGRSEGLTGYLRAIGHFHRYSFHNVLLIASQSAVTCCYTSLESMDIRSCALLEASDGA